MDPTHSVIKGLPCTDQKKKFHIYIQCKFSLNPNNILHFYFMSKCRNVFKALKMNIMMKAGKLKGLRMCITLF